MKKILISIGLALAVATSAVAQQYAVSSILISNSLAPAVATANAAGQATVSGPTNGITKWGDCALQFRGAGDAAGTDLITIVMAPSLDGSAFSSVPDDMFVWKIKANGTTTVTSCTNMPSSWMGSYGYWKILYITNASSTVNFTNATLKVAVKPRRTG